MVDADLCRLWVKAKEMFGLLNKNYREQKYWWFVGRLRRTRNSSLNEIEADFLQEVKTVTQLPFRLPCGKKKAGNQKALG